MADVRIKYKVDKGALVIARTELEKINKELGITNTKGSQLSGTLKTVGGAVVAAFTIDKLVDFSKKVVEITAEFDKLRAVLTNTLGSKSQADAAFARIQEFASKTPFSVQQLTQSFVKLANQGFVPTNNELRKLGDLAASTGKDFNMLAEAIIDAKTGEFERLKEFGIRATKEGDKVTFAFKGVKTQVDFTSESIQGYILSLGDLEGVSGSMAAISKTLGGQISNLGDSFDALFYALGQASGGIIMSVLTSLGEAVQIVTRIINASNGITTDASEALERLNQEFANVDSPKEYQKAISNIATRINSLQLQIKENIGAQQELQATQSDATATTSKQIQEIDSASLAAKQASGQFDELAAALGETQATEEDTTETTVKTATSFEELTSQIKTQSVEVMVLQDFLSQLQKRYQDLAPAIDQARDAQSKANVSIVRDAQEQLNALGGQSEATLDEIEKFTLEAGEKEQAYYDKSAELANQDLKAYEEAQAKKRQIDEDEFDRKVNLAFQLFDIGQMIASNQIASLQNQKAYELKLAGDDADAKARIEEEFDRKLSQIRRKQAIASKAGALLEIFIATRESVMKAVAASPLTGGLPWSAINAGIGVAQAGLVLAEPIPKFKHGVIDLKGGVQGQDSIHAMLTPHESVMTERETRSFLPTLKAIRENRVDPSLLNAISEGRSPESRVISVVNEVPRDTFMWDEGGFSHYMQRKNVTIEKKNVRYKC